MEQVIRELKEIREGQTVKDLPKIHQGIVKATIDLCISIVEKNK